MKLSEDNPTQNSILTPKYNFPKPDSKLPYTFLMPSIFEWGKTVALRRKKDQYSCSSGGAPEEEEKSYHH